MISGAHEGMYVTTLREVSHVEALNVGAVNVPAEATGQITRVGNHKSLVRFRGGLIRADRWGTTYGGDITGSVWIDHYDLTTGGQLAGSGERRLGTKPDGDEHIDAHDPRLEWLWDDLSKYASGKQWCGQFDQALAALNLPPRKKEFTARGKIGAITINGTVMARSQEEADAVFTRNLLSELRKAAAETTEEES